MCVLMYMYVRTVLYRVALTSCDRAFCGKWGAYMYLAHCAISPGNELALANAVMCRGVGVFVFVNLIRLAQREHLTDSHATPVVGKAI